MLQGRRRHEHPGSSRGPLSDGFLSNGSRGRAHMKVTHVISGLQASGGGPSYSVPALVAAQRRSGVEATIATIGETLAVRDLAGAVSFHAEQPLPFPGGKRLRRSPGLRKALGQLPPDLIHSHGLWQMPGIYALETARRHAIPCVVSPRGMLSSVALGFSRTTKAAFRLLFQDRAMRSVSLLHATAESELAEIRAFGLRQPVALLPNGIDLPQVPERQVSEKRSCLYLGRIHPKKGLDKLVLAWSELEPRFPDWHLRIIGPDEGECARNLSAMVRGMSLSRVTIEGPLYEEDKWDAYRQARFSVLPTHSENFGMTVAESLACERPVVCSTGAPWSGLVERRCGWWVDPAPHSLAAAMAEAMMLDDGRLEEMGRSGRQWMQQAFSWDWIGQEMASVYRWLAEGGAPPSCVYLD